MHKPRHRVSPAGVMITLAVIAPLAFATRIQATNYADADSLWRLTLSWNPTCWTAHEHLAESLQRQGRIADAIHEYEDALRIKPDLAEAHLNIGELEMDGQQTPLLADAAAHFEQSIRIEPSAEAHENLGLALLRMGRAADAIPEDREALRLQPDFSEVHCQLGLALEATGESDEAASEDHECLLGRPQLAHQLALRLKEQGNEALDAGRFRDAIGAYREALRLVPDFNEASDGLTAAQARLLNGG